MLNKFRETKIILKIVLTNILLLSGFLMFSIDSALAAPPPERNNPSSPFPFRGTFITFHRDFNQGEWSEEFAEMRELDIDTVIIYAAGRLAKDPGTGTYFFNCNEANYPSTLYGCTSTPDRIGMVLNAAKDNNMKVYVGLNQTANPDWTTGEEFDADFREEYRDNISINPLPYYNRQIAQELLNRYGNNPAFGGWFFPQEIWLNDIKYYRDNPQPGREYYYGTKLLEEFVKDLRLLDPTKTVFASPAFKKDGGNASLSATDLKEISKSFIEKTKIDVLAVQDGIGAINPSPDLTELGTYFAAIKEGLDELRAASSTFPTRLWNNSDLFIEEETDQNRYKPASIDRLVKQVNDTKNHVEGYLTWIYGFHMSTRALYHPNEAKQLRYDYIAKYNPPEPEAKPESVAIYSYFNRLPAPNYNDSGSELTNFTGGGYGYWQDGVWIDSPNLDFVGFDTIAPEEVIIQLDLGSNKWISTVDTLYRTSLESWIIHPDAIKVEVSTDGQNYQLFGQLNDFSSDDYGFNVDWGNIAGDARARYVKITYTHRAWLFIGEIQVR